MATMFKAVKIRPASDADTPIRVILPDDFKGADITRILNHALTERNVPTSDKDLTTRIVGQMAGQHGFTLNGRTVTGDYAVQEGDYVQRIAPDGKPPYLEIDLVVAGKQVQGYR